MLLKVPVPWVFILAYLIGVAFQYFFPVKIHSAGVSLIIKIAGVVVFVSGGLLAAWSLFIFRKERTTTVPGKSSKKIVDYGPYRFSRNPMYVSLILAYLGEAGLLTQLWPVILLLPVFLYVNQVVIPLEEEILKKDFKEAYEGYRAQVNRWF